MSLSRILFSMGALALLAAPAQAQNAQGDAEASADVAARFRVDQSQLPNPGTLPGSGLHGLELMVEGAGDLFVGGEAQVRRDLRIARERLAEALALPPEETDLRIASIERAQARIAAAMAGQDCMEARQSFQTRLQTTSMMEDAVDEEAAIFIEIFNESPESERAQFELIANRLERDARRVEGAFAQLEAETPEAQASVRAAVEGRTTGSLLAVADLANEAVNTGMNISLDADLVARLAAEAAGPDANIDTVAGLDLDGDGSIDVDFDGLGAAGLDLDGDGTVDLILSGDGSLSFDGGLGQNLGLDIDGDGDVDIDTTLENAVGLDLDGDGTIDVDVGGDGTVSIRLNGDGTAGLDIDSDGTVDLQFDSRNRTGLDTNLNGRADVRVESDGNVNLDADNGGDANLDLNGDGSADIRLRDAEGGVDAGLDGAAGTDTDLGL